jgi:methyl-CpG-binding domain protein 4
MTIQEEMLARDPSGWRMLCACVLLNVATGTVARRVLPELFARWPTARAMRRAHDRDLQDVLRPLGLQRGRAYTLRLLSIRWDEDPVERRPGSWREVAAIPGLGPYAADSWRLFAEGDLTPQPRVAGRFAPTPKDKVLRRRLRELS